MEIHELERFNQIFWDIDSKDLDLIKDKKFIIARILEEGDLLETKWLFNTYQKEEIIDVIKASKNISKKTANFFKNILNIQDPILCLNHSFQKTQRELWNY